MKKGFTLIEILYYMLILGIILSFSLPKFKQKILETEKIKLKDNILYVYKYEQKFFSKYRKYDTLNESEVNDDGSIFTDNNKTLYFKKGYIISLKQINCDNNLVGIKIFLKDKNINKSIIKNSCKNH